MPHVTDNRNVDLVVVLPVAKFDHNLACKLLRWMGRLAGTNRPYPLVIFATPALTEEQFCQLGDAAEPIVAAMEMCRGLDEQGYFGGTPSSVFKGALDHCEQHYPGCAMLWVEADAVPMRRNWYEEIQGEYRQCNRPFMGDIVRSKIDHLTGVAVYPPNWRTLAPSLAALPGPDVKQGWDSACAHETLPQAAKAATIQQIWRPPKINDAWVVKNIRPETALFHQCKDGSLIDVLTDRAGQERIPLSEPLEKSSYGSELARTRRAPTVEILITSFSRDMEFLRYCLASVAKYATGFAGVTVLVPAHEAGMYDWIKAKVATVRYFEEEPGKGFLSHAVQICRSDEWLPNADFIVNMDSDCMFFRPVTPAAYVQDWRARLVCEPYSRVTNKNRFLWRDCVKNATGITPDIEVMVCHPQVHARPVYQATRDAVEEHTKQPFDEYVLSCRNDWPMSWAEFPTIGTIGLRDFPDSYNLIDYNKAEDAALCGQLEESFQYLYRRDREFLVEFWSGDFNRYKADCDAILAGRTAAYYIK